CYRRGQDRLDDPGRDAMLPRRRPRLRAAGVLPRRAQAVGVAVKRLAALALASAAAVACTPPANKPDGERFRIERLGPASIQILPNGGQLPYCLAFTASDHGVVRLLTMSAKNEAFKCDANQPAGGIHYRVPPEEGPVRVIVVFSDQQIEATPIAAQVREI